MIQIMCDYCELEVKKGDYLVIIDPKFGAETAGNINMITRHLHAKCWSQIQKTIFKQSNKLV